MADDPLMQIYGVNTGRQYGPSQLDLTDPTNIDWNQLASAYSLSPEEVQQLQVPAPAQGPTLQQRLESLRPNLNLDRLQLSVDGQKIRGRMEF